MQNVESFYNELTPILEKIKESPEEFLEGTEVSKVTLWRWTNGINRKYPDPHKLLSILSKISGINNPKDLVAHFGGEISKYLTKTIPTILKEGKYLNLENSQNLIFKDFNNSLIFILCETESGASKSELINTLGNLAFKKLGFALEEISSELINGYGSLIEEKIVNLENLGIIKLNADGRYHTASKDIVFTVETMVTLYPDLISGFTRKTNVDMDLSGLFGYQQSIPLELAKEIKAETKEFFLRCYLKMKEKKCKNGIPYQIIGFSDKLFFEKNEMNYLGAL